MNLNPSLSDPQNVVLWVICTFAIVMPLILVGAGVLGVLRRK